MQPKLIPCGAEHFEELISFIVRLNSEDAHHIGFFGEGEADVRASLAECVVPPAEGFHLAYAGDQLVGVFGVDADPEDNRAWQIGRGAHQAGIADQRIGPRTGCRRHGHSARQRIGPCP